MGTVQLIPNDLKFDTSANPPRFASAGEDENVVEKGTKVRLKIVGTRVDATEIFAIGRSPRNACKRVLIIEPCRDY